MLSLPLLLGKTGDEEPEKEAEEDEAEQLSFHRGLEGVGRNHAVKNLHQPLPALVGLLDCACNLFAFATRVASQHLFPDAFLHLAGLNGVYAKQAGCYGEQTGQAIEEQGLQPEPAEVALPSDLGHSANDGGHDQGNNDHFQGVEEKSADKAGAIPQENEPVRFLGQFLGG